jgi:transcriptional antiterminator NusG
MSNELTTNLASSKANTSIARWYAVQVASSCEKKVKATLEQRSVTLGVNNRIIEIEIPQTPGIKLKKDGSRQTTEEKVFPGYVLVRMILDEDTMMAVKSFGLQPSVWFLTRARVALVYPFNSSIGVPVPNRS